MGKAELLAEIAWTKNRLGQLHDLRKRKNPHPFDEAAIPAQIRTLDERLQSLQVELWDDQHKGLGVI